MLREFSDSQKNYGANDYPPVPPLKRVNVKDEMALMLDDGDTVYDLIQPLGHNPTQRYCPNCGHKFHEVGRCPKSSSSNRDYQQRVYSEDEPMKSYSVDSRGNKRAVKNFKFHKADERLMQLQ